MKGAGPSSTRSVLVVNPTPSLPNMASRSSTVIQHGTNESGSLLNQDPERSLIPLLESNLENLINLDRISSTEDSTSKDQGISNHKSILEVATWNINSIRTDKYERICKFINRNNMLTIIAINEYVNNKDDSNFHYFANLDGCKILHGGDAYRIALAFPKFLESKVLRIESLTISQKKRSASQKCDLVVHYAVYKIGLERDFYVGVCYMTPDCNANNRKTILKRIYDDSQKFRFFCALGDFNLNYNDVKITKIFEDAFSNEMTQVINEDTRVCNLNMSDGRTVKTSTRIDLIFNNGPADSLNRESTVVKTSKKFSDHYMASTRYAINFPKKFVTVEKYLDPTRRKPFKNTSQIAKANEELAYEIAHLKASKEYNKYTQSQLLQFLTDIVTDVLDNYCPYNTPDKVTFKKYRQNLPREIKSMIYRRKTVLNAYRRAKRRFNCDPDCMVLKRFRDETYNHLRSLTKVRDQALKKHKRNTEKRAFTHAMKSSNNIWEFVKMNKSSENFDLEKMDFIIKEKSGCELANHLSDFIYKRANLVPDSLVAEHAHAIPLPSKEMIQRNQLMPNSKPKDLPNEVMNWYNPKKGKPSLACGPDGISQSHILELMPTIGIIIKDAMMLETDQFVNIEKNYTRLIAKGTCKYGDKLDEKSVRPIVEANILQKYGPVKKFVNEFENFFLPRMNHNQFAFPGKGTLLAMSTGLDNATAVIRQGYPAAITLWDFSNAFCTFDHKTLLKIARMYDPPEDLIRKLELFLDQTSTQIKINDQNGYYLADLSTTNKGGPQGQIGYDKIFALCNDAMIPEKIDNDDEIERADRNKFVDDFTDVYVSRSSLGLYNLILHNKKLLYDQATSIGLKMNETKTKNIVFNCDDKIIAAGFDIVCEAKTLGITFNKNPKFRNNKNKLPILVDGTATSLISKLCVAANQVRSSCKTIKLMRFRLDLATKLIWTCINDIHEPYIFCEDSFFKRITVAINNVIRASGLCRTTPTNVLYRLTLGISPENIAKKSVICETLKRADLKKIENDRYLVKLDNFERNMPMMSTFSTLWNKLPLKLRRDVIDLKLCENKNADKAAKNKIKKYLSDGLNGGELSQRKYDKKKYNAMMKQYKKDYKWFRKKNKVSPESDYTATVEKRTVKRKLIETAESEIPKTKRKRK